MLVIPLYHRTPPQGQLDRSYFATNRRKKNPNTEICVAMRSLVNTRYRLLVFKIVFVFVPVVSLNNGGGSAEFSRVQPVFSSPKQPTARSVCFGSSNKIEKKWVKIAPHSLPHSATAKSPWSGRPIGSAGGQIKRNRGCYIKQHRIIIII